MNEPIKYEINIHYGWVELDSCFIMREDGKLQGMSRTRHYNINGRLEGVTEWKPTGAVLFWPKDDAPYRVADWLAVLAALLAFLAIIYA